MDPKSYLITGGAGFVGSNIAVFIKQYFENADIYVFDNLKRRGSELNLDRLNKHGVKFIHGDVRIKSDFVLIPPTDCIIECSAEPSVLAGRTGASDYLIDTNLMGTVNCLNYAVKHQSDMIFLSTSRVYPVPALNRINCRQTSTRWMISDEQAMPGVTPSGISEDFPIQGHRSLYGATKLCSEILIQEYISLHGIRAVINRCGVITGPWQMGKVDQGFVVLWVAKHLLGGSLNYIGFGGKGKQVRDILNIRDLSYLIMEQIRHIERISGMTFNVGGGEKNSLSLCELTEICQKITGRNIPIGNIHENRPDDIRLYITNNKKVISELAWEPEIDCESTIAEISRWISDNQNTLVSIL